MPRAATTLDVFNAVAEEQRRRILTLLAGGERPVSEIAGTLGLRQPQASKHLGVLRQVGLVTVRVAGQQRLYRLNPAGLRLIHEWTNTFVHLWTERLDRLDDLLQELQGAEAPPKEDQVDQDPPRPPKRR